MEPDFSGWATKANLRCSDGRTIKSKAFAHMDGKKVPLVWQHRHNEPGNVIGHGILSDRGEGVWVEGYLNETANGKESKILLRHGDIDSLSIFANNLVEQGKDVLHGVIREVSLVLSGANPGAKIVNVQIAHGDGELEPLDEAIIFNGLALAHAEEDDDADDEDDDVADVDDDEEDEDDDMEHDDMDEDVTIQDVFDSFTEEQKEVVHSMLDAALDYSATGEMPLAHAEATTIKDVYDSFTEEQKKVVHYMIGAALEADAGAATHSATTGDTTEDVLSSEGNLFHQEGNEMRNAFENNDGSGTKKGGSLNHAAGFADLMTAAEENHSTLQRQLKHAEDYGINDIELLFPDAKALANSPEMKSRRMEWVSVVLGGTKHTPFAKVKSLVFDITAEEARAKGYIKGNQKKDEVIQLLRRTTGPATIYKKQKLDRDDVIDITDIDVVNFLRAEMRLMIEEELARAILVGDGRSALSEDKVKDPMGSVDGTGIRSILHDNDLYSVKVPVVANSGTKNLVTEIIKARTKYRGSGKPTLFISDNVLTDMMLLEDKIGRSVYETEQSLADKLRVANIVPVEIFDEYEGLVAILVNLADYSIGTNKGGELTSFDDFNIDFNQYIYLQETRLSGALTKPYSAVVVTREQGESVTPTAPSFNGATNVLTVPTKAGVVYQIDGEAVTGTVTITEDVLLEAVADEGYYFPAGTTTSWAFTYTP